MMIYGAKDLAGAFRTVRGNTLTIANELTEEQYSFSPADGTRTVGQLLTHISLISTLAEQVHFIEHRTTLEGFDFPAFMTHAAAEERKPRTKADTITLLTVNGESFASRLEGASDEFLAEVVGMPAGMTPAGKTRFEMLLGVKEHEMHHRGQLMLIERMLGIVPHLTRQMMERFASQIAVGAAR